MSPSKPDPYAYQVEGVKFLQSRGRAFLGDEPGLGKSKQLLDAASGRTLVVAPAMVLDGGNWDDQIQLWAPGADVFQAPYSGLNAREKTGKSKSATRPTMALHPDIKQLGRIETLILDECHYVKGRSTFWTQAAQAIARQADQVFLATGTPIPNWPHELFVPLQLLFPHEAKRGGRFGSYWRWVEQWFYTAPNQYSVHKTDVLGMRRCNAACLQRPAWDPCEHYHEFVAENLGDRFLQRLRDDVLPDLPALTEVQVRVEMTPKQYAEYRSMKRDYVAEVQGSELVAWSDGAKNVILDKMTTGLGILGDRPSPAESGKFQRLEFDLSSRARPTLVTAHYRASVEAAAQVAQSVGAKTRVVHGGTTKAARAAAVREFQQGKCDVLCGSLETIAEGLTLTAADMVIFVEKSWKPSRNTQAKQRIHRIGQTRPCTALDYVAVSPRGGRTVDVGKRETVAAKTDVQVRTLTAAQMVRLL
ncbi:MAG TPA: DEAD/DEAH box helicase [Nocardioidaceae bacterium]|nr:DEAD/DEAH box helicase [Nocardioidaceae bacterium]